MGVPKGGLLIPTAFSPKELPFGRPRTLLCPPEEVRAQREAVLAHLHEASRLAVRYLGMQYAQEAWLAAKPRRRRGNPGGTIRPENDLYLLALYDACDERAPPGETFNAMTLKIAKHLADQEKKRFYQVKAKDIAERLRRLVNERATAAAAIAASGSILGSAIAGDANPRNRRA